MSTPPPDNKINPFVLQNRKGVSKLSNVLRTPSWQNPLHANELVYDFKSILKEYRLCYFVRFTFKSMTSCYKEIKI